MPRDGTATRERILDAAQQLVLERGFAATSVDAVIEAAETTKGGFFHHFRSKPELGWALLDRYAAGDERVLDEYMAAAEAESDDPAEQLVAFVRRFEDASAELAETQPGCLFVTFVYEARLDDDGRAGELIRASIRSWRERIKGKLEAAAASRPLPADVDVDALADHVFTTFEGAFILARAMGDPSHLGAQIGQLRRYLELVLGVGAPVGERG